MKHSNSHSWKHLFCNIILYRFAAQNIVSIEHEINLPSTFIHLRAINPNPIDFSPTSKTSMDINTFTFTRLELILYHSYSTSFQHSHFKLWDVTTGIFSATVMQNLSKSFQVGAEYQLQKPTPEQKESSATYSLVYTPPPCTLIARTLFYSFTL